MDDRNPPEPPEDWAETLMRQRFNDVREKWNAWFAEFRLEIDTPELAAPVRTIDAAFEELASEMTGPLV